jgi:hypothetical protein
MTRPTIFLPADRVHHSLGMLKNKYPKGRGYDFAGNPQKGYTLNKGFWASEKPVGLEAFFNDFSFS